MSLATGAAPRRSAFSKPVCVRTGTYSGSAGRGCCPGLVLSGAPAGCRTGTPSLPLPSLPPPVSATSQATGGVRTDASGLVRGRLHGGSSMPAVTLALRRATRTTADDDVSRCSDGGTQPGGICESREITHRMPGGVGVGRSRGKPPALVLTAPWSQPPPRCCSTQQRPPPVCPPVRPGRLGGGGRR